MPETVRELLDEESVGPYLVERGIFRIRPPRGTELTGGVSNVVVLVDDGVTRVVVKQALPQLKVADDWFADPARAQTEAAALRLLGGLDATSVPALIDDDPSRFALTIAAAPPDWVTWKDELMTGRIDPGVGAALGGILRHWHRATDGVELPPVFNDLSLFDQLRLRPFFDVAATRRPDLAQALGSLSLEIRGRRRTLVLGDFSPKNILVGPSGLWVIDHEVAHRGDPAFDVAFMLSHLAAKAIHLPATAGALSTTAREFLAAYGDAPGLEDETHLGKTFAGLLLARVVGASPLPYLTRQEREVVEARVSPLLRATPKQFESTWSEATKS